MRINGGLHQNPYDGSIGRFMDFSLANLNISLNAKYSSTYDLCDFSENTNSILNLEFNGGPGDTVYDISGNGNHGVINGATYSDEAPEQNCDDLFSSELSIIDQLNQSLMLEYINRFKCRMEYVWLWLSSSISVADGLSSIQSIIITRIIMVTYMPEFGFNYRDFTSGCTDCLQRL